MRPRLISIALVVVAAVVGPALPAHAAFPGGNGLIAFNHEAPAGDHTQTDIFVIEPDGTGLDRLLHTNEKNEFEPAWNPAGTRIAFWRTQAPFGPGNLWVMDAEGSNQRRLTKNVDARNPAWNAKGTRLVYTAGGHLFTLRVSDGGDRHQLTKAEAAADFEPAWSPDGRRIAFTRGSNTGDGDVGDIYVLDLDTHHLRHVTDTPAYDHQVAWSPNGARLVFERDLIDRFFICTIRANGTGFRKLTGGPHFDTGPAWSPSGGLIAFGSDRGSSGGVDVDLFVMRPDGTHLRQLADLKFANSFPDWQAT